MVGDASLWIVVGANLCRAVAGGYHCLSLGGDVVQILLVLLVVNEGAQACQGSFLVFGLVAGFGTFNQDFLVLVGEGVAPHVACSYAGLNLVYVLATGTAGAEGVPLDGTFVDFHVKFFGFGKDCYRCSTRVYSALCLSGRYALNAVNTALVLHDAVNSLAGNAEDDFLEATRGTFVETGDGHLPSLGLNVLAVHAEKVAGKNCRFVAAGAATNFHNYVLVIFGVGRDEKELYLVFKFGDTLLAC